MLTFSDGTNNKKLRCLAKHLNIPFSHIYSFDLPAGYSCPAAQICKTYANPKTHRIVDAKGSNIRCYAASQEMRYPKVSKMRWQNFLTLRNKSYYKMLEILENALPKNAQILRIHVSGDFFSLEYFHAWLQLAKNHPSISFYGYSKSIIYTATKYQNFHLIYSHGGKQDQLADNLHIPQVYVVKDTYNPPAPIICNREQEWMDYEYILQNKSFSILVHGTQPKKERTR